MICAAWSSTFIIPKWGSRREILAWCAVCSAVLLGSSGTLAGWRGEFSHTADATAPLVLGAGTAGAGRVASDWLRGSRPRADAWTVRWRAWRTWLARFFKGFNHAHGTVVGFHF